MSEPTDEHLRMSQKWLERVNALIAEGEDDGLVCETMLAMAVSMALAQDGHRATSRNLYMMAVKLCDMADKAADADVIARDQMLKAGLRLN